MTALRSSGAGKSKVLDLDVIDGVATVKITAQTGTLHWIAKSMVTTA